MSENNQKYRKLPARPFSLMGTHRLWQGPDHLLWVENIMGQENYRRFYYKDIQAIILKRTIQHRYWSIAWCALGFLFGAAALFADSALYACGSISFFFFACLVVNLLLGPACDVYLQTAVQLQRVFLGRLKKAQRILNRLKELIEAQQGRLDANPLLHTENG